MLSTVVFPEPLGPMRPVMLPRSTLNEHPSTATIPPKRLRNSSISRIGASTVIGPRLALGRLGATPPLQRPAHPRLAFGGDCGGARGPRWSSRHHAEGTA